jgi:predicted nucleic acid-binding protein
MKVLVDSSVWSLAFRRDHPDAVPQVAELHELIGQFRASIIGPVRQEVLSGIPSARQFATLLGILSAFPDEPLETRDFELAARFFNQCRKRGIQGTHTDFLICASAFARNMPIFTTDKDFIDYSRVLPIRLHQTSRV